MELKDILLKVRKPGRYAGGEVNSSSGKFSRDKLNLVLAYPDTYEIGMSYLGMRILYHLVNETAFARCERVFAPWKDMEEELASGGMKLFSIETRTPLVEFDVIGFSLSYELTYTNVLNMLHLSGVPVIADERGEDDPLVIAGGACCYNPEPMSAFIDVFIIGDAEETLPAFLAECKNLKETGASREEKLRKLARLEGVYVPSLYEAEYSGDVFKGLRPRGEGVPERVKKIFVNDLENAYYPEKQIVPLTSIVHDRIAVEVMRGCPNACRFCQASAVNRPVRIRSPKKIREICRSTYDNTGYEQISLLSLSSVNYPHLEELVRGLTEDFRDKGVGISIPSLRVDEAFYKLPEMISAIRKAGLTFAPESADEALRSSIGKAIDTEVLCRSVRMAYTHGWKRIKLYFMVGFTGDTESEAEKILDLAHDLSRLKRSVSKGAAEVRVSINPFVPKPHTPLQWLGMKGRAGLVEIRERLYGGSGKRVKIEFHDIDRSLLEGALSRGGRELAPVIMDAWKGGARLDAWTEHFNFSAWEDAFSSSGMDIETSACRRFSPGDPLPWGHIDSGVKEEYLVSELTRSGL